MSALSIRLEKAAARIPPPPAPNSQVPTVNLSEMLEPIKARAVADAAFLAIATSLQLVVFHRDAVARLEARLAESAERTDCPLLEQVRKVQTRWIPSFLDAARARVCRAELDLLREAGFSSLDQPGAREHLELELFAA